MSTNIERAAEVILHNFGQPGVAAWALAAEGLLVTDEQQRLIRLGEAVERLHSGLGRSFDTLNHQGTVTFSAIYAEADKQ